MDPNRRSELIEKLAQIEVEMDSLRKRMPEEVESLEKLLNSVDELNALGRQRDLVKAELNGSLRTSGAGDLVIKQNMATIKVVDNAKLEDELLELVQDAYNTNVKDELFYVGVSGGSLPPLLIKVLKRLENVDWKKWLFFFCDERCVSSTSPDSTFGVFRKLLEPIDERLQLSLNQFITIDPALKSSKVAEDYLSKMRQRFEGASLPRFHILFLGLGPDGHTCSLFPGHRLLKETSKWVAFIADSPKPPPERVTMTFPVINNAKLCVFVATGESKAQVVKEILEDKKPLPAGMVQPHSGKLVWLLDKEAGSKLRSISS